MFQVAISEDVEILDGVQEGGQQNGIIASAFYHVIILDLIYKHKWKKTCAATCYQHLLGKA